MKNVEMRGTVHFRNQRYFFVVVTTSLKCHYVVLTANVEFFKAVKKKDVDKHKPSHRAGAGSFPTLW